MREIRPSGSEGGADLIGPYLYRVRSTALAGSFRPEGPAVLHGSMLHNRAANDEVD
jgi:hypothetical protein